MADRLNTIDPFIMGVDTQRTWSVTCVCGRVFPTPSGHSTHITSCKVYMRRLQQEQEEARPAWELRNRDKVKGAAAIRSMLGDDLDFDSPYPHTQPSATIRRVDPVQPLAELPMAELEVPQDVQEASFSRAIHATTSADVPDPTTVSEMTHENSANASEPAPAEVFGRGFRRKKTSTRLKDFIPHGKVPLGLADVPEPPSAPARTDSPTQPAGTPTIDPPAAISPVEIPEPKALPIRETAKDRFGLYKRYQTEEEIPHDPDGHISLADLQDEPAEDLLDSLQAAERNTPRLDLPQEGEPNTLRTVTLQEGERQCDVTQPSFYPYPNKSCFELGQWFWGDEAEKSNKSFQKLVSIVGGADFCPDDIRSANWTAINRDLGSSQFEQDDPERFPWHNDGTSWAKASVTIDVPFNTRSNTPGPQPYTINDFRHRPLVPLIREKLEASASQQYFHFVPHEQRWHPGSGKEDVRVHCEVYHSDAFLEAYEEIQTLPREGPDDDLPRCVVGLMFASDSTMLAHFGDAKLWPLYLFFANDSKYRRSKTSLHLGEQVAYFEKLPDEFKDWVLGISGQPNVSRSVQTHCHRELLHAQLRVIFDDDFMHAYEHGIVVQCADGVKRRFYPRILTYSADYPEKIILASIRNLGACPCTRCSIQLKHTHRLGMVSDKKNRSRLVRTDDESRREAIKKAREWIYESNYSITNERVENLLGPLSFVPTRNAFSERLSPYGFNFFDMLTSDVMHEVEIGVWKSVFIQLLRLLDALASNPSNVLDSRFRQVPTFGKDTIRRFRNNISEMKQLAARDYEDMLQCAIPVFEGLFDDQKHNKIILSLLFILAHWHGLAKMRTHTDHTLKILDDRTTDLGSAFRTFLKEVCQKVNTKELKRESDARKRREAKKPEQKASKVAATKKPKVPPKGRKKQAVKKGKGAAKNRPPANDNTSESEEAGPSSAKRRKLNTSADLEEKSSEPSSNGSRKSKTFSLHTFKFHALGHVVTNIKRFGCSDNYSTQGPESYHRAPKGQYRRTSKKKVTLTLSRIQMRQARIRRLRRQLLAQEAEGPSDALLQDPYFIGKSQNNPVDLAPFLMTHRYDPATKKFLARLKAHLLPRIIDRLTEEAEKDSRTYGYALPILQQLAEEDLFSSSEANVRDRDRILIEKDRLYRHEIMNVNFTTYEGRRDQDILNPNTSRRDFMCLREDEPLGSDSPQHRFCYGRLLGIYHVNVVYQGRGALDRKARRFDVLWVRWYQELEDEMRWSDGRLDRLGFYPLDEINATDFLDPAHVLRACHVIPRFSLGKVVGRAPEYSPLTKASDDWVEYVINRFVDRDMLMRYHWGLGVGHLYSHGDAPNAPEEQPNGEDDEDDGFEQADDLDDGVEKEPFVEDDCSDGSQYTLHDREDELAEGDEGDRSSDEDGDYDELPEPDD